MIIGKYLGPYIVIAIMGVLLYKSNHDAQKYRDRSDALEETVSDMDQKIKYSEVRLNDSISLYQAEIKSLKVTRKNLKDKYDKLLKTTKTKSKEVKNLTQISSVIHRVDTVIAVSQPFNGLKAVLDDDFVKINVRVFSDMKTIIDYRIRDSLTILNIQKRHSLLFGLIRWKSHKGVRVINHNPKADIVSLRTVDVIE